MKKVFFTVFVLVSAFSVYAQNFLVSGLDAYARSDWSSAIMAFQKAIAASQSNEAEEAHYWLIMAQASAHNYKAALDEAESFLKKYRTSARVPEVVYQKGRIYCLSSEYEKSINGLYRFIQNYPNHRQIPSAYYWIGENLYLAGRLPDARNVFSRVLTDYPYSAKVESAKYKIALIDQAATQEELLKLLKTSHEETLKLAEEYERRQKTYEQTIAAYQKQLSEMNRDSRLSQLAMQLEEERKKNAELYDKLALLEMKNQELLALLGGSEGQSGDYKIEGNDYDTPDKRRASLEALRKKARQLEAMYDKLLEGNKQ